MKRICQLLIILVLSTTSRAQQCNTTPPTLDNICEDGKGIRTDPDDPFNCEGADVNGNVVPWRQNNFDWRPASSLREYFDYYIDGSNGAGPLYKSVINPFTDPTSAEYYPHISFGQSSNNQPDDGWELMKVEFGSPDGAADEFFPKLPYIMLYNKYSGTLRFFGVLADPNTTYKTVQVTLSIPKFSPGRTNDATSIYQGQLNATNLLSIQGESIQPLDQETTENSLSVFARYSNNDDVFMWFDVPLAYDPCVCEFKSQFDVHFKFIQEADIDITGDITGSIKTTTTSGGSYATKSFGKVLAAGLSAGVAIGTGGAIVNVKAFTELIDLFKDNPNTSTQDKENLTKLKGVLNCGVDLFDVVQGNYEGIKDDKIKAKDGKKLLDGSIKFFNSAGKGCQSDKSASTISARINATGTVTQTDIIDDTEINLALPGSKWDLNLEKRVRRDNTTNNRVKPAYPLYNERLGTFALLKTPEFDVHTDVDIHTIFGSGEYEDESEIRRLWSMRLSTDLIYAFNPVLNLDPNKTKIFARIVITKDLLHSGEFSNNDPGLPGQSNLPNNVKSNPLNMEYLPNSEYKIFSPYMPIDYLKSMPIRFSWYWDFLHFFTITNNHSSTIVPDFEGNTFIQFTILAESNQVGSDGEKNRLSQILTFPVKFNNVTSDPNGTVVTGNYVQSTKDFDIDENFISNTDLFYEGPVFISAKLSTSNGAILRIYSLNGFEIEPGAEISPEIELIPGPHLVKNVQSEATYNQVKSFCGTNEYKANAFSTSAKMAMAQEAERYREQMRLDELEKQKPLDLNFKLFPNPTRGEFTLAFDYEVSDVAVSLLNINGKEIFTQNFGGELSEATINANRLEPGVYIIEVRTPNGQIGIQRLMKY